jgi:hypothetical protein
VYAKHVDRFQQEKAGPNPDVKETIAFKLLSQDPEARLVIYCKSKASSPTIVSKLT